MPENPDISNAELVAHMSDAAKTYARYFVNGHLQNPSPAGADWTLDEALGCCESFYVLEALQGFHKNAATCTCSSVTVQNVSNLPRVCMYYSQGWCVIHQSGCRARTWV